MKFRSTRSSGNSSTTFEDAICSGYAPDGGLYVPETLPIITGELLKQWQTLSYPVLMEHVLRLFIDYDEISDTELKHICTISLNGFINPDFAVPVIPIVPVDNTTGSDTAKATTTTTATASTEVMYVAELFHGPTFCFKDLGMRMVVNMLSLFASKRNKAITILVSTTGDTGPAAVRAVADSGNPLLTILAHYPNNQISAFQKKQLTTVQSPYVHVVAFEGGGDDMDKPIKNLLQSNRKQQEGGEENESSYLWTGVNSYNIGRPLTQMVHFIWTYLRIAEQNTTKIPTLGDPTTPIDIIIPTGAMGNIAGGYMSKKMGLPIRKLIAAVNDNDITDRVIRTGKYYRADRMYKTLSDAINIQLPYNFERLLFYLSTGDPKNKTKKNDEDEDDDDDDQSTFVRNAMNLVETKNGFDLQSEMFTKLQTDFSSCRVTDDEMCSTIRMVQSTYNYLCDPHTAVAFCTANKLGYLKQTTQDNEKLDGNVSGPVTVVAATAFMATASPCKFEESITIAIGTEKWNEYCTSGLYPQSAKTILSLEEVTPTYYDADPTCTLEENQSRWESLAREIIVNHLQRK